MTRRTYVIYRTWWMVLGVLLSVGCGETEAPRKPGPAKTPVVANKAVEVADQGVMDETTPTVAYRPQGKRDPFRSLIRVSTPSGKKAPAKHLPPLQREEISDLRFAGVVWGNFGYKALIQTPDGKGYLVQRGTLIGLNRGVVNQITETSVVIEERHTSALGDVQVQEMVIALHPKKGEVE